jgi:hypothetical protein
MSIITQANVSIHSRNFKELPPTHGKVTKIEYNKKERTENALKACGFFLLLMVGSLFVPIVHFFAVPGFFLAAVWFGQEKLNEVYHNEGGTGECPKCHAPIVIEKSKFKSRLTDTCGKCFEDLEMYIE